MEFLFHFRLLRRIHVFFITGPFFEIRCKLYIAVLAYDFMFLSDVSIHSSSIFCVFVYCCICRIGFYMFCFFNLIVQLAKKHVLFDQLFIHSFSCYDFRTNAQRSSCAILNTDFISEIDLHGVLNRAMRCVTIIYPVIPCSNYCRNWSLWWIPNWVTIIWCVTMICLVIVSYYFIFCFEKFAYFFGSFYWFELLFSAQLHNLAGGFTARLT
jgi:hypothetical protein